MFPMCPEVHRFLTKTDGTPAILGDGICDFIEEYMTKECNYENGDCVKCQVEDPKKLRDGICDGGQWNTKYCEWDGGDCEACNVLDGVNFAQVGDGICNGGQYNTQTCSFDGGDCNTCNSLAGIDNIALVGDGVGG